MRRSDFFYPLPHDLIAQYPLAQRAASRLLCLDGRSGARQDQAFVDLPQRLDPGDLLVFNDTKVVPARLLGVKASGGRVEILIERILGDHHALAHVRASKSPRIGARFTLERGITVEVVDRQQGLSLLRFGADKAVSEVLEEVGHVPLPPYIDRADQGLDVDRYQTVYARHRGAVAAPTAGLHFDAQLITRLQDRGIALGYVTLHVGAGTFQPVRCDLIQDHVMHSEQVTVGAQLCAQLADTRARGGRVIAVGTTSVRALEWAAQGGETRPCSGETQLFIYPGYRFRSVDALVTNFHYPESTLLMLLCAFAGTDHVMAAYEHAVQQGYRFLSYGDAMFVTRYDQ